MLLRFLCDTVNGDVAERFATIANVHILLRESSSLKRLEALLLGSAGLLVLYGDDDYVRALKSEYSSLSELYDLHPMTLAEWSFKGRYTHHYLALRLVQLAACYHSGGLARGGNIGCKGGYEAYAMLSSAASEYWAKRLGGVTMGGEMSSSLSNFTITNIGINVLAPMVYARGLYMCVEGYKEHALRILDELSGESNIYTSLWGFKRFAGHSATDSQAVIQLTQEYCRRGGCASCPLLHAYIHQ